MLVISDLTVGKGVVLTIAPGVVIQVAAGVGITVDQGSVLVSGTAAQPVVLTSYRDRAGSLPVAGDWGTLRFIRNGTTSSLEHVRIAYGKGVVLESSSPALNYLSIESHEGAAISMDLASSPTGVANSAQGNTVNGILVPGGEIQDSVVWGLRGIPYVVPLGSVSVGKAPTLYTLSPNTVVQGSSVDATLSGSRLTGVQGVSIPGLAVALRSGSGDTSIPITITAPAASPLGFLDVEAQVAAGNPILAQGLEIISPFSLDTMAPVALRRGQKIAITVTGKNLVGVSVSADSGLIISALSGSESALQFNLEASAAAMIGPHNLSFINPQRSWSLTKNITVRPRQPFLTLTPAPLGLMAGAVGVVNLMLSNTDDVDHEVKLTLTPHSLVFVSPSGVVIPAGTTGGGALTVQAGTSNGSALLKAEAVDGSLTPAEALVMVGRQISSVSPKVMALGTGPNLLTVNGFGLGAVTQVAINTSANSNTTSGNLALGAWSVNGDGTVLTLPVSVANAAAAAHAYYVTLWGGSTSFGVASADASRFDVKAMPNDLVAQAAGVTVGGATATPASQVFATPAGVSVGGNTGTVGVQVFAAPAGVAVGGNGGAASTQVFAPPAGITVGGSSGSRTTQVFTQSAGVVVGGNSGAGSSQIFAQPAGITLGGIGGTAIRQVFAPPAGVTVGAP